MALAYKNLDPDTRRLMLEEVELDVAHGTVYVSRRLTPSGTTQWAGLLRQAIRAGSDDTLAASLAGLMNDVEEARSPRGGTTTRRVPVTAPETLAEGEFNRYYARAVCRRAMELGVAHVVVYRAKAVARARPESEMRVGSAVPTLRLLDDLRANIGVDTALGIPAGPNSGLSVSLPT